jgi:hypothetical protein
MNEQLPGQPQEKFSVVNAHIPETVRAFAEECVLKTRERYTRMNTVGKEGVQALEEVMLAAQSAARAIGERAFHYTVINVETAFDAAQAMARANTIPEAIRIQASYIQHQLTIGSEQTKTLFELSAKGTRQTFDGLNLAATKTFEQFKTVS